MGVSERYYPVVQACLDKGINTAGAGREAVSRQGISLSRQSCGEVIKALRALPPERRIEHAEEQRRQVRADTKAMIQDAEAEGLGSELARHIVEGLAQLGRIASSEAVADSVRGKAAADRVELAIDATDALRRAPPKGDLLSPLSG